MNRILLLLFIFSWTAGCASKKVYQAYGDCAFKPERKEGYSYKYIVPASGECKFHIESEIKRSRDLEAFAEAFTNLINSGFNAPIVSTISIGSQ